MGRLRVMECELEGLKVIESNVVSDKRGSYSEMYNYNDFRKIGINIKFVQDNLYCSTKGVLKAPSFQINFPQVRLIRVLRGEIFAVAVDVRKNSSTFGEWYSIMLSRQNMKQFYVPEGFACGFMVVSDEAEVLYKCSDFCHQDDECGIVWNDPEIGIEWPVNRSVGVNISERDMNWKSIKEVFKKSKVYC